jgi:hypothetical protein
LGDSGNNGGTASGTTIKSVNISSTQATLTLSGALKSNKYFVEVLEAGVADAAGATLDGLWTQSVSTFAAGSGNGAPGTNFIFRFDVLAGDANRDGKVNSNDVNKIHSEPSGPDTVTDWQYDINGDKFVNSNDVNASHAQPTVANIAGFPEPILPPASPVVSAGAAVASVSTAAAAMSPAAVTVAASPASGLMAVAASGEATATTAAAATTSAAKASVRSAAADLSWVTWAAGSSDGPEQQKKKDLALQALDSVFAQYGRS